MELTLGITLVSYLGALAVLWYASMKYSDGASVRYVTRYGALAMLMLMTASGVYYDYTDAPAFRAVYALGVLVLVWFIVERMHSQRSVSIT